MAQSHAVKEDDGRKQAEANFNIGIALEKRGNFMTGGYFQSKAVFI